MSGSTLKKTEKKKKVQRARKNVEREKVQYEKQSDSFPNK